MRILMISPKIEGIGGIGLHVKKLVERLERKGYAVDTLSSQNTFYLNIRGLRNPSFSLFAALKSMFMGKYDIVHAHNIPSAIPMRTARGKRILTIHGVYSKYIKLTHSSFTTYISKLLEKRALKWADAVTAVSKSASEYYRTLGVDVHYIPNAIDLADIPSSGKKLYDPQVVFAGRLSREKGVDVLIDAFKEISDAHLIIIGKGPEEKILKKKAEKYSNIHFLGFLPSREEVLKYILGSDLFVLPSRAEGLPTVILEAMACRVPVVATAVDGNLEVIEHEKSGLLVPPEDSLMLRDAIRRVLEDKELAKRLVENAYNKILTEYNWDVVFEKYHKLYIDLTDT